ncbi:MAG: AraC family transcriptional regulator [Anaerobacillus sp.]|uniref:AraC family transcriptional regulator n=1 Tax=Anaerobacillus sp. TaxID=1872506 RepID=UPI00391D945B
MTKMEVKENKKLVLKQVLIKQLKNIQLDQIDEEVTKFTNQMQLLKVQTFGPLITKTSGTNFHEDGKITMDYELMVQAHDYKQYKKTFHTSERFECSNCVYLRYEGAPENIHYATSKLDLYFFENELASDGSTINVHVSESTDRIVVDIFKPVLEL